jgi:hypothetical protein
VLAGAALLGLGFLVLASHIRHGGFHSDDWSIGSGVHFDGYWDTVVGLSKVAPGRPVLVFLQPLPHVFFGLDAAAHLALAVVLAALTSLCFFAFLRALGVEAPHALGLALLSVVFPWAGSVRMWPTASVNNVALIAYFLGTIAALRALGIAGPRRSRAIALHALAAALYVISVLTYQVAPAAILLSGLLYRTRFSWRALRGRWLLDVGLVLVALVVSFVATSHVRNVGSLQGRISDVPHFVRDGLSIFAAGFLPRDISSPATKLFVLALAVAVVAASAWRARECKMGELRQWLQRGTAAAAAVGLGYITFLGSSLLPLSPGLDDRVNTFAAFGFVGATYSVLALVALLIGAGRGRAPAAILAFAALLVGVGWIQRVRDDAARYDATSARQRDELARLRAALPQPPHGSTLFTFGYPAQSAPGMPIFAKAWDLSGAVRLRWNDPSLDAFPIYRRGVSCGRSKIRPLQLGPQYGAAYGNAVFVDLSGGHVQRIRSRGECLRARDTFEPGPLIAG